MTKRELYGKVKAWIEAALPVGDRVIQAKPREQGRERPAVNVPQRKRPYVTMEITVTSSLAATALERTTDKFLGSDPETENRFEHLIQRRRYCTMHLEIYGEGALDMAEQLIDSRRIPTIHAQLRAAEITAMPLTDPIDISEQTGTAWDERAALDFRIHYLLTTSTEAPIIETAGITLKTWPQGQSPDDEPPTPPEHEDTFTVP